MLAAVCAAAAVMFGCVPSLQPLATEEEWVVEPKLVGTWVTPDSQLSLTFEKADNNTYTVVATEGKSHVTKLVAGLIRLDDNLFCDTTVKDVDLQGDLAKFHLLPVHLFTKITLANDTLTYATLNFDWLKKLREERKLALRHEMMNDGIVLTAPTKELQEFLRKHAGHPDAFQPPTALNRKK